MENRRRHLEGTAFRSPAGQSWTDSDGMSATDEPSPYDPKVVGKRIHDLRMKADLGQAALAARAVARLPAGLSAEEVERLGITGPYISLLERGGPQRPSMNKLNAVARGLGVGNGADMIELPLEVLYARIEGNASPNETKSLQDAPGGAGVALRHAAPDGNVRVVGTAPAGTLGPPVIMIRVPVLGRANAGPGGGMIAERETTVSVPEKDVDRHDVRVLLVSGDCMEPDIRAGDHALVDAALVPRERDIVAVRVKATDEILVKRYGRADRGRIRLTPNIDAPGVGRAYDLGESDIEIIGVVYSVLRSVGRFDPSAMGTEGAA